MSRFLIGVATVCIYLANALSNKQNSQQKRRWVIAVLGLLILASLVWAAQRCSVASSVRETQQAVVQVQAAAIAWQIDHGDQQCPNMKQIIGGKYLPSQTRMADAWGQALRITCHQLTIGVKSAGPDGIWGTADDVIAHPKQVTRLVPLGG